MLTAALMTIGKKLEITQNTYQPENGLIHIGIFYKGMLFGNENAQINDTCDNMHESLKMTLCQKKEVRHKTLYTVIRFTQIQKQAKQWV